MKIQSSTDSRKAQRYAHPDMVATTKSIMRLRRYSSVTFHHFKITRGIIIESALSVCTPVVPHQKQCASALNINSEVGNIDSLFPESRQIQIFRGLHVYFVIADCWRVQPSIITPPWTKILMKFFQVHVHICTCLCLQRRAVQFQTEFISLHQLVKTWLLCAQYPIYILCDDALLG